MTHMPALAESEIYDVPLRIELLFPHHILKLLLAMPTVPLTPQLAGQTVPEVVAFDMFAVCRASRTR